jgi:hypothetical protein
MMQPKTGFGQQIVAADHALARMDEELEEIEDLRLDRNEPIATAQLATVSVEDEVIEMITQNCSLRGGAKGVF